MIAPSPRSMAEPDYLPAFIRARASAYLRVDKGGACAMCSASPLSPSAT